MSIRRPRLAFRPNVGGPKARANTAKQKEATDSIQTEAAVSVEKSDNVGELPQNTTASLSPETNKVCPETQKEASSSEATGKNKDTKSEAFRRPIAKPKPKIPQRGARNNVASSTSEKSTVAAETSTDKIVEIHVPSCVQTAPDEPSQRTLPETGEKDTCENTDESESITKEPEEASECSVSVTGKTAETESPKKENKPLPAKFRRFAKARPNIEAVARPRIRHPSFSQGDSDPALLKDPPPIHRVVTATIESPQLVSESGRTPNVTPRKDIVDVRNTPLKTPAREEIKQEPPNKKVKKTLCLEEPVDRKKMKMKDLIRMNPKSNPMKLAKQEEKDKAKLIQSLSPPKAKRSRRDSTVSSTGSVRLKLGPDGQIILDSDEGEEEENAEGDETQADGATSEKENEQTDVLAPQVTIGADGEIVLNEESLVLDNPLNKPSDQEDMEVVHESSQWSSTPMFGYTRRKRTKIWSDTETKKFYLALSAIGTDFSLMVKLFPTRSRRDLKKKFEKEEKTSRSLVDKAISDKYKFQFEKDFFEELYELDKQDEREKEAKLKAKSEKKVAKPKKKERQTTKKTEKTTSKKKKPKKKHKSKMYVDSSSESDEEMPDLNDETEMTNDDDDEATREVQAIAALQGTTSSSGRTIKTFVLGQPGASATMTTTSDKDSSTLVDTKASTEIRIRRVSGRSGSPGRHRIASGSSTASTGKTPGQFLALSNLPASGPETPGKSSSGETHAGSLVFVRSSPSVNEKGETTPGLVHMYMVTPGSNPMTSPQPGPSTGGTPINAEQFTSLRSTDSSTQEAFIPGATRSQSPPDKTSETIEIELDVEQVIPCEQEEEVEQAQVEHTQVEHTQVEHTQVEHTQVEHTQVNDNKSVLLGDNVVSIEVSDTEENADNT